MKRDYTSYRKVEMKLFSDFIRIIKKDEVVIGLVIFFFSIFVYIESAKLPDFGESFESPGLLPAFIAVIMFFLSILMIIGEIKKELSIKQGQTESQESVTREPLWNGRIFIAIILILLYIGVLTHVSFLIASIVFLFILMTFLKASNIFIIGLISITIPIAIQYVFANIFQQLIP